MPQMHAILKHWHPMIGWDFHIPWVPGTPAPAPAPVVYKTCAPLAWVAAAVGLNGVTKMATSHVSQGWGYSMLQDTDIGTMIPHIGPPSLLLPLDILFSASKSYFFTSQYKAEGANVAVALAVIVNPNLNCGTPIPTPTGLVLALNTHFASMSFAEFMAAMNRMAIEFLVQAALNFILGKVGDLVLARLTLIFRYYTAAAVPKALSKQAAKQLLRRMGQGGPGINNAARALVAERNAGIAAWFARTELASNPVVSGIVNGVLGYGTGGPMGFDNAAMGGPTVYGSTAQPGVDAVDKYFTEPRVEEFPATPATPPAAPPTPAPAPTPTPTPTPTPAPAPAPTPTAPAGGNYNPDTGVCEP